MIQGKLGAVYRTNGVSVVMTNEATNSSVGYTKYTIASTTKRYIDDSVAVTVKKIGVTVTSGYTIEYAGGVVVFTTPLINTDVITVSGNYFNIVQCATFFNWKIDFETELKDVTTFASSGWKDVQPTLKGWNGNCEGYWADGTFISLLGQRMILILYVDNSTNKRYEGYVYFKKNSITQPTNDIVKESVEFLGDDPPYYHE